MKNNTHLLITGRPGIGKTTLIKKTIKVLSKKKFRLDGFYTEDIRENQKRVGFMIMDVYGKKQGLLSHIRLSSSRRIGKYRVDVNKMDEIVEKLRKSLESRKIDILIIDEIGPMELYSENFKNFIVEALRRKSPIVIGTIKEKCLNLLEDWKVQERVRVRKMVERDREIFNVDTLLNFS